MSPETRSSFLIIFLLISISAGCSDSGEEAGEPLSSAINIFPDDVHQEIRGFGGVNMPGWDDVGDITSEEFMKAYGTGEGQIGLNILRIRVPYDTAQFYLEVPVAQLAASMGAIILASPWSPPPYMKSNNNIIGGFLDTNYYDDFADYLESFSRYMSDHGAPLYAVSVQNEPDANVLYESCNWNTPQMLRFAKENAQQVTTRILLPESLNFDPRISDAILNDPQAAENVDIIGGHIYGGEIESYPLASIREKELWMTEHFTLSTDWTGALDVGKEIADCMNAGMNAYIWWYLKRFYGPIDSTGNVSKKGYVMSQFARFVRPGFRRVTITGSNRSDITYTAYKNGPELVVVVVNSSGESFSQEFIIENSTVSSFTPYVTSESKNCQQGNSISISNNSFTVEFEASSVTTLVSD